MVVRIRQPDVVSDLSSLAICLPDKICLITAHGLVLRLRPRAELVLCQTGYVVMWPRQQALRVADARLVLVLVDVRISCRAALDHRQTILKSLLLRHVRVSLHSAVVHVWKRRGLLLLRRPWLSDDNLAVAWYHDLRVFR